MSDTHAEGAETTSRKRSELRLFVFLVVFLFPILAVAVVGGYGFLIWMTQLFLGPPGPPA
ncbi:periplasmic nitrate reductase, NapE protein [Marinobacter sp.]|uniref:periplasmic nitrate reductase, NapE protein n=1 Tax=Marinobacter sp. TaxID=50741 RepID=UPI0035687248